MIEPRRPGDNKPPTMRDIWPDLAHLRDSCAAARPIIAAMYLEGAGPITHQVLWPTFRRAIEAVIAARGAGLSEKELKYYSGILKDWPFHGRTPREEKNTNYNLGLKPSLYGQVIKEADKDRTSIAKFIVHAIEAELARREAAK